MSYHTLPRTYTSTPFLLHLLPITALSLLLTTSLTLSFIFVLIAPTPFTYPLCFGLVFNVYGAAGLGYLFGREERIVFMEDVVEEGLGGVYEEVEEIVDERGVNEPEVVVQVERRGNERVISREERIMQQREQRLQRLLNREERARYGTFSSSESSEGRYHGVRGVREREEERLSRNRVLERGIFERDVEGVVEGEVEEGMEWWSI